jgi:hypothetical protein
MYLVIVYIISNQLYVSPVCYKIIIRCFDVGYKIKKILSYRRNLEANDDLEYEVQWEELADYT